MCCAHHGVCLRFFLAPRSFRYFYNFLVWLWLGCLFLMSVTLPLIAFPTEAQQSFLYARGSDGMMSAHEGLIFFVLVLTAAAACAVGALLALHSYLVLTNQTTIEMYANGKKRAQARRRGEVGTTAQLAESSACDPRFAMAAHGSRTEIALTPSPCLLLLLSLCGL